MNCDGAPPPEQMPSPTTIHSLGEDLLLEIFLLLPSLATLVSAALTCRAWRRAVASSPSFRSRFRALHPAPFLGVFTNPYMPALPVFTPAHNRDQDVLAAVRGGDFFLTSVQQADDELPLSWTMECCRDGYLLLMNWDTGMLAIVNPLAGHCPEYIEYPDESGPSGRWLGVHLLSSEEDPISFRLLYVSCDDSRSRVRAAVFSSDTWDWQIFPWVEIAPRTLANDGHKYWLGRMNQVGRIMYWLFTNMEHILTLDTDTMEFSVAQLPACLQGQQFFNVFVGGTKDDVPCIAYDTGFSIRVLMCFTDEDGVDRWVPGGSVRYDEYPDLESGARIMAITDGFVYLDSSEMVISLSLETWVVEKLFPKTFCIFHYNSSIQCHRSLLYPYVMSWPPSLLGNYGVFAVLQDEDPSCKQGKQ